MSQSKLLIIDRCVDCKFCVHSFPEKFLVYYCTLVKPRRETPPSRIPLWCPLRDTSETVQIPPQKQEVVSFKPKDVVYFTGKNGVMVGTTISSVIIRSDGTAEHVLDGWAGRFHRKDLFRSPIDVKASRYKLLDRITDALDNSDGMTPNEIRDELRVEGFEIEEIEASLNEFRQRLSGQDT